MRAAIMLANFGRKDEAADLLEKLLTRRPSLADGHQMLGEIHLSRGNFDQAALCFQTAIAHARTKRERTNANLKLVEVYLNQKQFELAKAIFQEELKDNPKLESSINALRKGKQNVGTAQ